MTFAYTCSCTPIGGFGPTAEQRCHQNQCDCPIGMKEQHIINCLRSIPLDKIEAHGSATAICSPSSSLATCSAAAADDDDVYTSRNSSPWASLISEANHGTFPVDWCPHTPTLPPVCTHSPLSLQNTPSHASSARTHGSARARRTIHQNIIYVSRHCFIAAMWFATNTVTHTPTTFRSQKIGPLRVTHRVISDIGLCLDSSLGYYKLMWISFSTEL